MCMAYKSRVVTQQNVACIGDTVQHTDNNGLEEYSIYYDATSDGTVEFVMVKESINKRPVFVSFIVLVFHHVKVQCMYAGREQKDKGPIGNLQPYLFSGRLIDPDA